MIGMVHKVWYGLLVGYVRHAVSMNRMRTRVSSGCTIPLLCKVLLYKNEQHTLFIPILQTYIDSSSANACISPLTSWFN